MPDARRIHAVPTPRLGGLAIAAAILLVAWISRLLPGPAALLDPRPLIGLTCASLPILALGVTDDRRHVGPWVKLAVQACAAMVLVEFGYGIPLLTNPFGPTIELGAFNAPLTVLWVLVITNAINLIDGLDGLASGVVAIACVSLWVVARVHADFYVMFFASMLIGACAGFLRWNFPPANVFMGDTGSQFLGFMLAAVSLLQNRKGTATVTLLLPLIALALPLADSAVAFLRRLVHRQPVFRGDTQHVHHQLLVAGLSPRGALFVMWALSAMFAVVAVMLEWLPRVWGLLLITVLGAVLFVTFELLRALRPAQGQAAARTSPRRR
jgi:UDP-GlcNAc:undecaprenyl-phosphate/decaprenyl-phosphate GlcNAc-1-phosphate transferase